jgi:hypothetical protein
MSMRIKSCLAALAFASIALVLAACGDNHGGGPIDCSQCADHAACTPGVSTACECAAGYDGDGTVLGTGCVDVNECTAGTDDCDDPHGVCVNDDGGFSCGCAGGYHLDGGACVDDDECATGSDDCTDAHGSCTNTDGGFTCGCAPGYGGDGTAGGTGCTDVDECAAATDDCTDTHGTCTNTDGGFTCGCEAGYGGDGTTGGTGCPNLDECALATDDCALGRECIDTDGSFECGGCAAGFAEVGGACVDLDECALGTDTCVDANEGGLCVNTPGSYTCACDEDNTGDGVDVLGGGTGCTEVATNPRLVVPRRMVNDKTLTVRADVLDAAGQIATAGCYDTMGSVRFTRIADGADIPITVTVFDDHLPVPADSIRFYHGVGSVSFTLDGGAAVPAGDYRVTVSVGGLTASRVIHVLAAPTWRVMPAELSGADLVWGPHENIRISQHNTNVPAGSTLTILPGTIVMVDTTGGLEDGTLVNVLGQLDAQGSLRRPIHFFSERGAAAMTHAITGSLSNGNAWRGIFFFNNGSSALKWTVLTGAGNGVVVSHPRPPILNLFGTHNLTAEDDVLVDSTGMMFQSPGTGTYTIRRSLVSRVGIGAEFLSSGHTLRIEDTWWTGIGRGPTSPIRYDGDGIHVDGVGSNQLIQRCIVADIGDDGIDHSNSTFTVEDSIIHSVNDKAVSMTNGSATFRNVLVYDAGTGLRGTARVFGSTIATSSPITNPLEVHESVIWPGTIATCGPDVSYTLVGNGGSLGCGMGNLSVNPQFTAPQQCDYTPAANSPAMTAGPTGGRIGWTGFPSFTP